MATAEAGPTYTPETRLGWNLQQIEQIITDEEERLGINNSPNQPHSLPGRLKQIVRELREGNRITADVVAESLTNQGLNNQPVMTRLDIEQRLRDRGISLKVQPL